MRTPKLDLGNPNGLLRNEGDQARIRKEFLGPKDYNASCIMQTVGHKPC